jgi:hypothetical protein
LPSHNVQKPEHRYGSRTGSLDNDPRYIQIARGQASDGDIPRPKPDPKWKPEARSWFNSLALSGQSEFYEPSDWATAVAAAQAYDVFLRTYNASIFAQFVRLSERLGCTISDRKRSRIELGEPDPTDEDEDSADEVVEGWHGRLRVVD